MANKITQEEYTNINNMINDVGVHIGLAKNQLEEAKPVKAYKTLERLEELFIGYRKELDGRKRVSTGVKAS